MPSAVVTLLGLIALAIGLASVVLSLTWVERKFLARIQQRAGPSRVGPHGLLQPLADAIKLLTKEDLRPAEASQFLFWVAPIAVVLPTFLLWVTIPFADSLALHAIELGLLYLIGVSVLEVIGLLLAGWGSSSKYSMLGGFRAAAQLVSYEIPIIAVIIAVAIVVQSLDLRVVVAGHSVVAGATAGEAVGGTAGATVGAAVGGTTGATADVAVGATAGATAGAATAGRDVSFAGQGGVPLALIMPLGLVIFFISGLAELGRTPFDIHHAESEVVGGPFVEYSGAHWAAFYLSEYMNTFFIATLTVLLFFGGWSWPSFGSLFGDSTPDWIVNAVGVVWMLVKVYIVAMVIFWFRGTYPRLRIDQLMALGWQVLIPLSFVNLVLAAVVLYYGWPLWALTAISVPFIAAVAWIAFRRYADPAKVTTVHIYRRTTRTDGEPALVRESGSQ